MGQHFRHLILRPGNAIAVFRHIQLRGGTFLILVGKREQCRSGLVVRNFIGEATTASRLIAQVGRAHRVVIHKDPCNRTRGFLP